MTPETNQQGQQDKKPSAMEERRARNKALFVENFQKTANISIACQQTNINRWTYYDWIKKDEAFAKEVEAVRESLVDHAESKLMSLIKEGNITAIIFFLKCLGKKRGYIERQEVTGADGAPLYGDSLLDPRKASDRMRDALRDETFRKQLAEMQRTLDERAGIGHNAVREDVDLKH